MNPPTHASGAADRCQACFDRNDGFYGSYAPKCPAHNDDGTPRDTALAKAQQPALTAKAISAPTDHSGDVNKMVAPDHIAESGNMVAQAISAEPAGDERATFEANWRARNPHMPLNSRLRDDGRYGDHLIQKEWEAWQARAARASADSVLEDAARLDWLDQQCEGYGFQDSHEGNRWEISGPYANVRQAIDYERAARKQGATQ